MIRAWRWNDSCEWLQSLAPHGLLGVDVSELQCLWQLWIHERDGALLWLSLSYTSTLTFLSSSLSLPQMTRPIQVKPADSESRGGKEISFLPHFIAPHSFIFSFSRTRFLFRSLWASDISFDWKCSHSVVCAWLDLLHWWDFLALLIDRRRTGFRKHLWAEFEFEHKSMCTMQRFNVLIVMNVQM